jgi:hypothetical protein
MLLAGRHGPGSVERDRFKTRTVRCQLARSERAAVRTWANVTVDGKELWVSGRYDDEVYVFDT